jgi:hypothetical protein
MLRTTSIYNFYDLSGTGTNNNLVVRPPQNLKVFRAIIYADSRQDTTQASTFYVSNAHINSQLEGTFLSNGVYTEASVPVAPDTSTGSNVVNNHTLVLDRRNIGYMCDDLHFFGKGGVSIVWEGIIE